MYRVNTSDGRQVVIHKVKQANGLYTVDVNHYDKQGYYMAAESRTLKNWTIEKLESAMDFMRYSEQVKEY